MKKVLLVFSVLFLFSITGCDDNDASCTFTEFSEILENSDCISEDFISNCRKISRQVVCNNREFDIGINKRNACIVIDCQTLSCDTFSVEGTPDQSGFMTDMEFDEGTGFPMGIFEVDELVAEFECLLFQP
ncbi:MAG: hypothetical protein WBB48_12540 [Thermodesulfobacteriota bacterium]